MKLAAPFVFAFVPLVGCAADESDTTQAYMGDITSERAKREKLIYLPAINSGDNINPDMLFTVGADPGKPNTYGKIIHRLDLPDNDVQDGVHHFGYSLDRKRLLISGMFSNNMFVVDVANNPQQPKLLKKITSLDEQSGYVAPHTVSPMPNGEVLVSMLGAATESGGPAGLVILDDKTGAFKRYFGPGPDRTNGELGADYQYDITWNSRNNRMLTTTWGWPKNVFGPPWLDGDSVTMWNTETQTVIQKTVIPVDPASGYSTSGATEADWLHAPKNGIEQGFMITDDGRIMRFMDSGVGAPGSHFTFTTVVSGLVAPCDMTISHDDRFLYVGNWFGGADYAGNVQQYDITDPANPQLVGEAFVPHACMVQVSPDDQRLYVANSVTRVHDDYDWGRLSNDQYGLWLFHINPNGGLSSETADGTAWVKFDNVQKKRSRGPAGVHMMMYDPSTSVLVGAH